MAPLDSKVPPSEDDLRGAFHSPSVAHFLELAARDIVRRNTHLTTDAEGHAIYGTRMNATEWVGVFDPQLRRVVRCRVRLRITVEPDIEQVRSGRESATT